MLKFYKVIIMDKRIEKLVSTVAHGQGVLINSKANIFYYSGFTSEDCLLYISDSRRALLTDSRYTLQAKEETSGFEIISDNISDYLKSADEQCILFEEDYLTVGEKQRLCKKLDTKEFVPFQESISKPRYIKDSGEIKKINAAEALGDAAFEHILKVIKPGISEKDVALELEYFMKKNGASALSFDTICASGVRSSMPHAAASDKIIKSGEFITLDFGCVLEGYCSDMTRTVVVGKATAAQREIYNLVLKAQKSAIDVLMPALPCAAADKAARDIIDSGGYGKNFGHSLGHSVGIEIHESPNLSPKSKDILSAGNVVTVEPGIYIENFGGVRIEDLVVITETGTENLTRSPKELLEL